jgi:PAS domain S-box-containing protein
MRPLRTNDSLLGHLVQNSPLAIAVSKRVEGEILDVNDSFLQLFGYTRDEVVGQTSAGLGMWAHPTQHAALTAALVAGKPIRDFEATVRTKIGAECQVLATVADIAVDGSNFLLTQLYDITGHQQVEAQFQALVEQLPVITYVHGPDEWQTLTYISPQVETMLGYSSDEVLSGQPDFLTARTHPEDRGAALEAVERARTTGAPLRAEYRIQARDGRWVCVRDEAVLVDDEQGRPLLWQGVIADITERSQTEAARQEAELRYSTLFQHSLDAVFLAAPDGRILDANYEACRMFDRTVDDLRQIGREVIVDPADPRLATALAERARTGHFRGELTMRRRDGESFPAEVATQVFTGPDGQTYTSMTIRDLTDQRMAEAALRESQERFRSAFDHAATGMALITEDGHFLQVNHSLCTILASSEAELLGKSLAEITLAEDRTLDGDLVQQLFRGEIASYQVEKRLVRKPDAVIWGRLTVSLVRDPTGEPLYFVAQIQDITPFKAAGAALRESEERFRALVQNSYDVITIVDPDGTRRYISPSIQRLLGYRPADLLGRSAVELVHPDDAPKLLDAVQSCLRGVKQIPALELRFRHCDGSWREFETIGTNLLEEPSIAGIVFNSRDITPRNAALAALRESEERFRSAFDHTPIGMALVAQDGRFMQVNRALCELVDYLEEELLGRSFQDITHPEDLADDLEHTKRLWSGDIDSYQLEKRYLRKDGQVVWVQLTGSVVRDVNGPKYAIAQIMDITERRHLEMERADMLASEREYSRQLQSLSEMRADLTAMIAHELRAPVSALRMTTFLIATGDLTPQDEAEMFAAVNSEIERLDRLVSDVVAVTAAEREGFAVQLRPVSLTALLDSEAAYARTTLNDEPFSLLPPSEMRVWCDPERISQVLHNLLDNAAKHTPPGTPIELRAHREGTRVRIEVADQGPGLSAEDVVLIFEKFGRGHQAVARQVSGMGLGLYLSRQIVRAHGSDLAVESAPGTGTVFAFELEVAP